MKYFILTVFGLLLLRWFAFADQRPDQEPIILPRISTNTIAVPVPGSVILSTDTQTMDVFVGGRWRTITVNP